jgi:putative pyruvate formate lyase activating enzyme
MYRQTGDLQLNEDGLAQRGLLLRHLVLPNDLAGSRGILEFIAREISTITYINIMDQYYPAYKAVQYPELNRRITREELQAVYQVAHELNLHRLDKRRGRLRF